MDVHKDSVMIAVLPEGELEPTLVKGLSHDLRGLRRLLDRLAREHELRACYEASGTGYVIERRIRSWGHACEIVAPSLIPRRPGERRKHDRKDAEELARLYRAGELVTIRVPSGQALLHPLVDENNGKRPSQAHVRPTQPSQGSAGTPAPL